MLCDKCKKNAATYFSSVNINGNVTETHLCSECAKSEHTFNFNSFFDEPKLNNFGYDYSEPSCNVCGYSLSDYINTGLLGCPNCYNAFKDYLNRNMLNFQYGKVHTGKQLNSENFKAENINEFDSVQERTDLEILQDKLKKAVAEENYELASVLKKEIDNLQGN